MKRLRFLFVLSTAFWFAIPTAFGAPAVQVTLKLDANQIAVGETTTLHVFARIVEAQRANTDRIFSWYVDLLNAGGTVAKLIPEKLLRPTSDKDPRTSSSGRTDGDNQRGIYDTFLNLAEAGRTAPVELLSIPVQGIIAGTTSLHVQGGTTVPALAEDFIVAPAGGGDPLLGGDYSAASIELEVVGNVVPPSLAITVGAQPPGQGFKVTLTFSPMAGRNHFVEFRDSFGADASWQSLPGAPHNSGSVIDLTTSPQRFYRLRIAAP